MKIYFLYKKHILDLLSQDTGIKKKKREQNGASNLLESTSFILTSLIQILW